MTLFRSSVDDCGPKNSGLSKSQYGRITFERFLWLLAQFILVAWLASFSWAGEGGSILGRVTDSTGAVVIGATVAVRSADTGIGRSTMTNDTGTYLFSSLPIGHYDLEVTSPSFRTYRCNEIVIGANTVLRMDIALQVGRESNVITVVDNQLHVETTNTQAGETIAGQQITAVPLNGRSFTDLLALQPGVAPSVSVAAESMQDLGASVLSPSGDLNPGTVSINGQREFANSFVVNGSDVEEDVNMGAAIVPNLDSIAEFRIITNNFDAEYGEFSGGQISVVTKSGTNATHGDIFEFARNTNLDARNYFSPTRAAFHQNQFGATLGGPIRRNKLFFFGDYQGTRLSEGVDTGEISVPSLQDRTGSLLDLATLLTGTVTGPQSCPAGLTCWANRLANELGPGYSVLPGEPYYYSAATTNPKTGRPYGSDCTASDPTIGCVFPGGVIPTSAWSAPAAHLLQYIPAPNNTDGTFSTSAYNQTLGDDKGAYRLDANTHWGKVSTYYFLDDWRENNPYPVNQGGANVPGFNALYTGRAQLFALGDTKTLGDTAVNELHLSYMRDANNLGQPQGGVGVSLASQGFEIGLGTPGIVPLSPSTEGVESVGFNSYTIGTNTNQLRQAGNIVQWLDNFSKGIGRHTAKMGVEFHYDQVNSNAIGQFNGSFLFFGSETGSDFADFLLGIPSQYNQSQLRPFYGRNKYAGIYAQDSWRVRRDLTLNYGLRWDRIEPWYEKYNQIATFAPGRQSIVFPGAPPGILYPTDPGVPRTLAPPGNRDFAPRIGLAYSPGLSGDGLFARLWGGPGRTSIRASYGVFYTAIEGITLGVMSGNAPYGTTYTSPAPPLFATPFITAASGENLGQYFPVALASLNSSTTNPDRQVNWAQFEPISGVPNYPTTNRIPYTEDYMLSLERGFGSATNTVLSMNYIGTQAHRLLVLEEANPGDPSLCLFLSNPANLSAGQTPCGPFGENGGYKTAAGRFYYGTRGPLGSNFGSNANQATIGTSSYNALQVTVRHTRGRLQMLAGYTYSKSEDLASSVGEEVDPFNPALNRALSAFDIKHNFVLSYSYQVPFNRLFGATNRWTQGWEFSGIVHLNTGMPVTLVNYGDNSLLGSEPNGINNYGVDQLDYAGAPLYLNSNPRNGRPYFNPAAFSENSLGTLGTAKRRFFYGPGEENYDMALLKSMPLSESKSLQLRVEAFNVWNHAQFFGSQAVDGNIANSTFGHIISAIPPRLLQVGAKFLF